MDATSGIAIDRRSLLCLPAGLLLPSQSGQGDGKPANTRLDFAALVQQWQELAQGVLARGEDPDSFLTMIEHLVRRLDVSTSPSARLSRFADYDPVIEFGRAAGAPPTLAIQWRLAPGAVLPPHNHQPALVLSLCLAGECRIRHFDIDGDAPAPGKPGAFAVRETHVRLLRPGVATSLTPQRDNIHSFEAGPQGAMGIDLNVFLPGEGDWSMLEIDAAETDGYRRRRGARWIGKPEKR